jgi:hypothetical protein
VKKGNDADLRLSVYGGQGQSDLAFSSWISAKDMVFQAVSSRSVVTAEELRIKHKAAAARAVQKLRRKEREVEHEEQRKAERVLAEQRKVEREKQWEADRAREAHMYL